MVSARALECIGFDEIIVDQVFRLTRRGSRIDCPVRSTGPAEVENIERRGCFAGCDVCCIRGSDFET